MNTSKKANKDVQIAVVEVEKGDVHPAGTPKELTGAILTLGSQPGFVEILRRFRVARQMLRSRLEQPAEDANRHQLRALIEAYGFVERQLKQETGRPVEEPREAYADELQEYERLAKYVELIGRATN